jgi:carbonic anhydrase
MSRKTMLISFAAALGFVALVSSLVFSSPDSRASVSPDEALQKLMDGNKHYVENKLTNTAMSDSATRTSLAKSQKPYAIILSCSDSRVPPELIFDKGLGEIFVVRVAGNVPDPVVIGSIEYAAEHLGSPLVMVLGHGRCGAVKATVDSKGKSTGSSNIDAIVRIIAPSVKSATKDCEACNSQKNCALTKTSDFTECVSNANVRTVAASLTTKSQILKHLVDKGRLKIVTAKYDLDDGTVTMLKQ